MLVGFDIEQLRSAADEIKVQLGTYTGVYGVSDSFRAGKREMKLGIKPAAETLGLTLQDLGRQVRQAFYGEEAQRIQRGRDDIRVMVRYPEAERQSLGNLEDMMIRTPSGAEVPFLSVADFSLGNSYSSINRQDGRRVITVRADVDRTVVTPEEIRGEIMACLLYTSPSPRDGLLSRMPSSA